MLKLFRKKLVSRILLGGLVTVVIFTFVFFGSPYLSRSKDKGPNYVGIIDNHKVSFDELYNALIGVRSQIILNYFNQPKVLEALLTNKSLLAKIAWDRLLMLDEAKRLKIKVPDSEVIAFIRSHPLFNRNGAFDSQFYSYILRNNIGLEARAFEETVRGNIAIQKLSSLLTTDLKVSDEEVLSEYNKDFAKIKIAYVLLEPKDVYDQVKISDDAVKDFYEKHKNELMLKSNLQGTVPDRIATFDESKETIEKFLKESGARNLLKTKGDDIHTKIVERMQNNNETFEKAASQLKLTVKNTELFSRNDKLDEPGDAPVIANAAYGLKTFEVSGPVEITKGIIIFEITQKKDPDEEAFNKDKTDYAKKVHDYKVNLFMEDHLRKLEGTGQLAIKLDDIDKYYK